MSVATENITESKFELERIDESDLEETQQTQIPILKHLGTRDSIVSNDSDISLSGDAELSDKQKDDVPEDANMADNDTSESGSDDNTSSNEKDSGCEVATDQTCEEADKATGEEEEEPFVPPDDELVNKIVAQVEFYFSDDNITKDAFLLKHVRRNKEGYVSLKLISSFKRVKHLAKDWRVVAYALERSTKLEVNEARTKLRRVDPLPAFDQTTPSRTIIAVNLPPEKSTIESVAELFRPCGEIALIRIIRPGGQIPAEVRSFTNKHPEMGGVLSALIEFDRTESAKIAVERQDQDWRNAVKGMKVLELNAPPSVDRKKKIPNRKTSFKSHEQELSSSCQSGSEAEHESKYRARRSSSPYKQEEMLHRRFSGVRDPSSEYIIRDQYRERLPCSCCGHCERRYSSSGSGYDSPTPNSFRRYSITRELPENGYQIPMTRRHSGVESPCCMGSLRRCSRDSGSESSGSFTRAHESPRRFSRDSLSSSEAGPHRRFSRDSISSESSANFRRFSRDSIGSEAFVPPFLSRNNSRDIMDVNRRASFGSGAAACPEHHVLVHSGSRATFMVPSSCVTNCPPHMPDNVVRMPKGPDGSKGFGVSV